MNPLRLLLIDDNPDDRSLVARELKREFPKLKVDEVIDAASLEKALSSFDYDLVITDYQLRWNDGLRILKLFKARWPDCPVIMFTGTGSEEIAVEAMKAGLDDYVLKLPKHYARLASTTKVALRMRQQKRDLQNAELRYQELFQTMPIGLFRCTPTGKILDANPALVSMLEYHAKNEFQELNAEALHMNPADFVAWRERLERNGSVACIETQWRCADGSFRWVEIRAKAMRDSRTQQPVYEGSVEDITERKKAESDRENLIAELQDALAKVKNLSGLLPICAACKKIRDDNGYWNQIEVFIKEHSEAEFTHSFCPECIKALYPEVFSDIPGKA
ncbi:MAG: response regulator [Verrucomicrobiales bacterium]